MILEKDMVVETITITADEMQRLIFVPRTKNPDYDEAIYILYTFPVSTYLTSRKKGIAVKSNVVRRLLIALAILSVMFMLTACSRLSKEDELQTISNYAKINDLLKDQEFFKAEIEDGQLCLYDKEFHFLNQLPLPDGTEQTRVRYIRKEGNRIFFIQAAAVDDEEGIMFVNDETNSMMDGLASISRVGYNSYKYSTVMED